MSNDICMKSEEGLRTFRLQNSEFRQTSEFRIQTSSEFRLETSELRLLQTSDFGLQTLGINLPIFHSLLLCTNMDDVSRLPYRGALRGKKDNVGASFGLQFKWFGTSACLVRHKRQGERHPTACCGKRKKLTFSERWAWPRFLWCRVQGRVGRNRSCSEAC